ncbi:MAG: ABC transporter ATP-binding protein [Verrucomicrobiales bacterium]|nr:ABC transporter ATP-binding protein [Verrucomicrobiales bacterium]
MPGTTPPRSSVVLQVENLCLTRGGFPILNQVNWTVRRGEHWVLLGPNGSGKTSLLAALTGYLTPTAGSMQVLGEIYGESDWPRLRRRIGLVSSSLRHLFHEEEPGLEIVVGGRYAAIDVRDTPKPRDVREARALLRRVDCLSLADRPWAYLSQGERQRLLIARALMAHPEILILDEPCAGLDPVARQHFMEFTDRLARHASPSLVFVTHHVEEIGPAFRHALLLAQGRIAASGPIRSALTTRTLSHAFATPMRLRRRGHRYHLDLPPSGSGPRF